MKNQSVTAIVCGLTMFFSLNLTSSGPALNAADDAEPQAVEESMHEFMEYVFQPTYKRLKASMAQPDKDNAIWKAIKSDGLILAESTNLLLHRLPEENAAAWTKQSIAVRELGGMLYQAAREKDSDAAAKHYAAMLQQCNQCHKQFADGKYQLEP